MRNYRNLTKASRTETGKKTNNPSYTTLYTTHAHARTDTTHIRTLSARTHAPTKTLIIYVHEENKDWGKILQETSASDAWYGGLTAPRH